MDAMEDNVRKKIASILEEFTRSILLDRPLVLTLRSPNAKPYPRRRHVIDLA